MQKIVDLVNRDILHEQAHTTLKGSLITVSLAMSGSKWESRGSASTEHSFMFRISRSTLINLFNQIVRGNQNAMQIMSGLYRVGLGVPQSNVYSRLWTEILHHDALELSDGVLTKKDLRGVLKNHLRETIDASYIYVPSTNYMSVMRSVSGFRLTDTQAKKNGDAIRVDPTQYDLYLIYKRSGGKTNMISGFLHFTDEKEREKFIDFTYQSHHLAPVHLADNAFGKSDSYYVVYGKLVAPKEIDYQKKAMDWITQDVDRYQDLVRDKLDRESPHSGFLSKYRELKGKAVLFLEEMKDKRRHTKAQLRDIEQANLLLETYETKRLAHRELIDNSRAKAKAEDPVNTFTFRAIDLFVWSSGSGVVTVPESVPYKQIVKKLTDLGFTCNSKQGQLFVRTLVPNTYWQKR